MRIRESQLDDFINDDSEIYRENKKKIKKLRKNVDR